MYQHLTKLLLAGVVAALCAVIGTPAAFAQTVTGCLKKGEIKQVAVGAVPATPCAGDQIQVTLGAQGPPGAAGADGAEGPAGPAGDPAGGFQLIAHFPFGSNTDGVISKAEWNQCAVVFPGGRPANSKDILTLPWDPASSSNDGWVNPVIVAADSAAGGAVVEVNGVVDTFDRMTCRNFTNDFQPPWGTNDAAFLGTRAFGSGVFRSPCDVTLPIVCVVPAGP